MNRIPLEPAAIDVCNESAKPPLIFQIPPEMGRERLNEAQDIKVHLYPARISTVTYCTEGYGTICIYFVVPDCCQNPQSTIFYIHGAGWVFGNFHTHEKLVRELAYRTGSIVVFPEYSLSPEAKYPTAIEQCYQALCSLKMLSSTAFISLNLDQLIVAGDSVGGNMAIVMTFLSKCRNGPKIQKQLLYYPVTNACFHTCSYQEFSCGYYLYRQGMIWFFNQYSTCQSDRMQITVSPLLADTSFLCDLPSAMIINGEADVLRDEGEAYAAKLLCAGVDVTAIRIKATIHDFVMLHALDQTNACRTAMDISINWICNMKLDEGNLSNAFFK